MIRVLVVDDHPVFLRGLHAGLARTPDIKVVGSATDGQSAVELACDLRPDVVLMDVQMPGLDGVTAARQLHTALPEARVLALSGFDIRPIVVEMLEAGASGYVLKESAEKDIEKAIRGVMAGEIFVTPRLRPGLPDRLLRPGTFDPPRLTDREASVLRLVAQGTPRKEIADRLGLSPKTVEYHVRQVMERLEMESIADAVRYASARGWIGEARPVTAGNL